MADGNAYPLSSFIAEYGGSVEEPPAQWLEAPLFEGEAEQEEEPSTAYSKASAAGSCNEEVIILCKSWA